MLSGGSQLSTRFAKSDCLAKGSLGNRSPDRLVANSSLKSTFDSPLSAPSPSDATADVCNTIQRSLRSPISRFTFEFGVAAVTFFAPRANLSRAVWAIEGLLTVSGLTSLAVHQDKKVPGARCLRVPRLKSVLAEQTQNAPGIPRSSLRIDSESWVREYVPRCIKRLCRSLRALPQSSMP
jgi:hypothetical protein